MKSEMLYHEIKPYKMWFILGYDLTEMGKVMQMDPGSDWFQGRTMYNRRKGWVGVVLNKVHIKTGPMLISTLAHELFHVASFTFAHIDFWPESPRDDEPWAYLQEHLMGVSLEWMGYE